ncbi:cytochrome b/b6 domain-containing protein [Roseomonas sp. GC11]|uniref:cytochrome b n=1 Tax=Roseomonas sp. GC11 TaxID=2950546 RepID=UPI00210A32AD|nr:cytochrome b/b6 domain-containing protein [Roseomonas sp. GC11]MCQ4158460.1 cytochrome b/b6 domain-containing protein [Roseomonas sp. GC11]
MTSLPWRDTPALYGRVSRALHWGMALLFAWQFTGMGVRAVLGRHPVSAFFVGTHAPLGTLLLALVALRAAWALAQWRRRPGHAPGWAGRAALAGHLALYGLMLVVPTLALLRAYGSGRAFAPFGLPLFPGFPGGPVGWMVAPANALHGWLAWLLLALVAGHAAMALLHRLRGQGDVLRRMAGRMGGQDGARA